MHNRKALSGLVRVQRVKFFSEWPKVKGLKAKVKRNPSAGEAVIFRIEIAAGNMVSVFASLKLEAVEL
jgi:hypothetical protein